MNFRVALLNITLDVTRSPLLDFEMGFFDLTRDMMRLPLADFRVGLSAVGLDFVVRDEDIDVVCVGSNCLAESCRVCICAEISAVAFYSCDLQGHLNMSGAIAP